MSDADHPHTGRRRPTNSSSSSTMSDPRFARLRTDPRFRRIHKKDAKVVVDDRFASLFDDDTKSKKKQKKGKGTRICVHGETDVCG